MTLTPRTVEKGIADLAKMLYDGCLAHDVSRNIAKHPKAVELVSDFFWNSYTNIGLVTKKQGRPVEYAAKYYLEQYTNNPNIVSYMERALLAGSLITLGDALDKAKYLDRAPILELIRHLRNGIAHGNRFDIRHPERLKEFPAHNRASQTFDGTTRIFEIEGSLNGKEVLFEFIEPGDVVELILAVHLHVGRMI